MSYQVSFYCPDQHITYNLQTLNHFGVGGGITARIRLAHALARQGHQVKLFVNCPKNEILAGVEYIHFSELKKLKTDIFVATTSGDGLNLTKLVNKGVDARLKILMIHGEQKPVGFDHLDFHYIYAPSNYIASSIIKQWKIRSDKVFVTYRGVEEDLFEQAKATMIERDKYRLFYAGHPSKGLHSALAVVRILHKIDTNFSLHIYGGYHLWGEDKALTIVEPGATFHGLVGQQELARQMQRASFSINLQSRPEPFGMIITESMRAGCIVIGSPVGSYPELINHAINGYLIQGIHTESITREKTASLILNLIQDTETVVKVRKEAARTPITWDIVAKTWEGHWNSQFHHALGIPFNERRYYNKCEQCGEMMQYLADGLHCISCGFYKRGC